MTGTLFGPQVRDACAVLRCSRCSVRYRDDRVGMTRRVVTWTYDSWENKRVPAIVVGERIEVLDINVDRFPWLDVSDLLLEDVRPVLHEQTCLVTLRACFTVDRLGFFLFPENAANLAIPDDHQEFTHRGFLGERKQVNRFDLRIKRIVELLPYIDRADVTVNTCFDVRVFQGQRDLLDRLLREVGEHRACSWRAVLAAVLGLTLIGGRRNNPEFFVRFYVAERGCLLPHTLRGKQTHRGGSVLRKSAVRLTGSRACYHDFFEAVTFNWRVCPADGLHFGRFLRSAADDDDRTHEQRCQDPEHHSHFTIFHYSLPVRTARLMRASVTTPSYVVAVTRKRLKSASSSLFNMRCTVATRTRPDGSSTASASE